MNDNPQWVVMMQCQMWAQVAWMEAMKAENQSRESNGLAQAYPEKEFAEVANELTRLAEAMRQ